MRGKGVDVILALVLAAGLVYGAFALGRVVTRESNEGIAGDSPAQTATSTQSGEHDVQIWVALYVVAGMVAVAVVLAAISAFIRRPRRRPPAQPIPRQRR